MHDSQSPAVREVSRRQFIQAGTAVVAGGSLVTEAAIARGAFAEKPVAVDAPGVRTVLGACNEAKKKNLAVVSGLCWRYHNGARAAIHKVHDGAVGDVVTVHSVYNATLPGKPWPMRRKDGWS